MINSIIMIHLSVLVRGFLFPRTNCQKRQGRVSCPTFFSSKARTDSHMSYVRAVVVRRLYAHTFSPSYYYTCFPFTRKKLRAENSLLRSSAFSRFSPIHRTCGFLPAYVFQPLFCCTTIFQPMHFLLSWILSRLSSSSTSGPFLCTRTADCEKAKAPEATRQNQDGASVNYERWTSKVAKYFW